MTEVHRMTESPVIQVTFKFHINFHRFSHIQRTTFQPALFTLGQYNTIQYNTITNTTFQSSMVSLFQRIESGSVEILSPLWNKSVHVDCIFTIHFIYMYLWMF